MSARLKISVDGVDEVNRMLSRYDAQFEDLSPVWPAVRDEFRAIEIEQFESEGAAGRQGKWKPLSDPYRIKKIEQYGEKPILQASGELIESLTGDSPHSVYRPSPKAVELGSSLPRALLHQRGGGKLPQRKPIDFSDRQRDRLSKVFQQKLVEQMRMGKGLITDRRLSR